MGFFFQKHLIIAVSEVHLLVHKMLDFRSFLGGLPPDPLPGFALDPRLIYSKLNMD
jgi:hypothetical protein